MIFKAPSTKVSVFLVIVVVVTILIIILPKIFSGDSPKGKPDIVDLSVKNEIDQKFGSNDADNDKLPDWQEEIWGTDKNNPDTDGDGTTDGEEVNQNRNPNVAGPNDQVLSNEQLVSDYKMTTQTDPNSLTSVLSKNLLLRVAQVEQLRGTGSITGDTEMEIVDGLANQAIQEVQIPDKYPTHLFLTFEGTEISKLQNYADTLLNIQVKSLQTVGQNTQELDPLINAFKSIADQYSKMSVPREVLSTHAKITNNYFVAAEALINLKLSDKDPVLGLLSIPFYRKASEEQPTLYGQIEEYLKSNGIIFGE